MFVLFYIEMGQSDIQGAKLALMCHTAYLKKGIELQVVQAVDGRIEVETTVNSRKEYSRMEMTNGGKRQRTHRERQSAD